MGALTDKLTGACHLVLAGEEDKGALGSGQGRARKRAKTAA